MPTEEANRDRLRVSRVVVAAVAIFIVGLGAGWGVKPWLTKAEAHPTGSSSAAARWQSATSAESAARLSTDDHPTYTSKFISRLHDALSISNRSKRAPAFAAIADDFDEAQIRRALLELENTRIANREAVRTSLLARWGALEPEAAIAYAMALPNRPERSEAVNAVLSGWIEKDLPGAEKWLTDLPHSLVKTTALIALATTVAVTDPKHAVMLAQAVGGEPPGLVNALFDKWIDDEPKEAAAAAAQLPSGRFRNEAIYLVSKRWAEMDFESAAHWAESLPRPPGRRQRDPLTGVLATLLKDDGEAAVKWIEQLPNGRDKNDLIHSVFFSTTWDERNPAHAAELALLLPRGASQESLLDDAASQWANKDPRAAFAWATQQEDDRVRQNVFGRIAADWLAKDSAAASQWINAFPSNAEKTRMLENAVNLILNGGKGNTPTHFARPLIETMNSEAIRETAHWIAGISDAQKKVVAYEKLASKWLNREPEEARAWIDASPLSQDAKDRMLSAKTARQTSP